MYHLYPSLYKEVQDENRVQNDMAQNDRLNELNLISQTPPHFAPLSPLDAPFSASCKSILSGFDWFSEGPIFGMNDDSLERVPSLQSTPKSSRTFGVNRPDQSPADAQRGHTSEKEKGNFIPKTIEHGLEEGSGQSVAKMELPFCMPLPSALNEDNQPAELEEENDDHEMSFNSMSDSDEEPDEQEDELYSSDDDEMEYSSTQLYALKELLSYGGNSEARPRKSPPLGDEYQAHIPEMLTAEEQEREKLEFTKGEQLDVLVWSPSILSFPQGTTIQSSAQQNLVLNFGIQWTNICPMYALW